MIPAPRIVSRAEWTARAPKSRRTIATPTPRLWIHHTAGSERGAAGMRQIQAFHMDRRGWSDIAYSFVVDPDGTIYEGRGVGIAGGHTKGDNSESHAICGMGNYEATQPTEAMLDSIAHLAAYGRQQGWWHDVTGGHRQAPGASTACPGRHLQAQLDRIRTYQGDPFDMDAVQEIKAHIDLTAIKTEINARAREKALAAHDTATDKSIAERITTAVAEATAELKAELEALEAQLT